MSPDNFVKVLQVFSQRRPFRPFTLELISGGRIEVNHPEVLTLHGDGLVSCVSTTLARSVFEMASVVRFITETGTT